MHKTFWMAPRAALVLLVLLAVLMRSYSSSILLSNFTDQQSLLAFKSQIIDHNGFLANNWTESTDFCDWLGVSCSKRQHHRVTKLSLGDMGLGGTISPHIGNLSFLVVLDLTNNSFHGHIIHELGHLRRLKLLILEYNNFDGQIPRSLQHCQHLEVISVTYNTLIGSIPEELSTFPRLRFLFLGTNNLTGTIPSSLANISSLEGLEYNKLVGTIPEELSTLPRLREIVLGGNILTGTILSSLANLPTLEVLGLENNRLVGTIPKELSTLPRLRSLTLGGNNLTGTIPSSLANLSTLEVLELSENSLHGNFPEEIAYLPKLTFINAGLNYLSGPIPPHLFNLSSLEVIAFVGNGLLTGQLPSNIRLPNLKRLILGENQLTGKIPSYLSNSSMLTHLDLGQNQLTGVIPANLGDLQFLTVLILGWNFLNLEPNSREISFLTAFTRLRSLQLLGISANPLKGALPYSIGNLSSSLQRFDVSDCQIQGQIPKSIGNLNNLIFLQLDGNNLSGNIPSTIKGLKALQRLDMSRNRLEGSIPSEICQLNKLGDMDLGNNLLSGSIPTCIGNLSSLQSFSLGSNSLNSTIPSNLLALSNLLYLNLSFNSLHGAINQNFGGSLRSLGSIDFSWNQFSGNIPGNLGSFQSLSSLNLSHNSFQGSIPESLGKLISLDFMDLSYNNLSGPIPKFLESITNLKFLNLSHNNLSGEVPSGGPFANLTAESFFENEELCGQIVSKPCKGQETRKPENKLHLLIYVLPSISAAAISLGFSLYILKRRKRRSVSSCSSDSILHGLEIKMFTYQELCRATNNFCEANLLGMGSFGSVYKGTLSNGEIVAVKLLNLQVEGAIKSFDAECQVMRTVRHRNLVKIISVCRNPELRALVLEYMPNGSLHKWLYSHDYCLNLPQRVSIMLDVAFAVEYLHHGQPEPIIHCDLKPSNVMLDEDLVGHVGDFGIAKILAENNNIGHTNTLGTFGYIAPEYGSNGRVSTKGDIYSYGIMLLETFTRKRPTDEMFDGQFRFREWVSALIPNKIDEVIDPNLVAQCQKGDKEEVTRSVLMIINLGLSCCVDIPDERSSMKDVVIKLNKIKLQILSSARV